MLQVHFKVPLMTGASIVANLVLTMHVPSTTVFNVLLFMSVTCENIYHISLSVCLSTPIVFIRNSQRIFLMRSFQHNTIDAPLEYSCTCNRILCQMIPSWGSIFGRSSFLHRLFQLLLFRKKILIVSSQRNCDFHIYRIKIARHPNFDFLFLLRRFLISVLSIEYKDK